MSIAFMWFCIGLGIKPVKLEYFTTPVKEFDAPGTDGLNVRGHYVVSSGKVFVDWTARQFWKDVPYPLVVNEDEMRNYWLF